ncbi:uncharacterized protein BO97DRAFT_421926 [Aspergillus homomorphus CBS 101889]|uniref:ABC transporter domain-containing protein n=1 Tax=Aspergillus homomorphus (strain CBS 101889) TaxID=1450537 RepID=A0A395I5R7_ASPHC|nr:hypothetical protein BO97DRAFT_421926 [Aspergillus homomorphus CBS 101889]RAL15135.1 hypothetical protein BO97DRAFT_421926 [Aspergillus homomorphus CBS 101889]
MADRARLSDPLEDWLRQEQPPFRIRRGVSFTAVNVNGYTEANSIQHTFLSYFQLIPVYLKALVGFHGPRQKVPILRDLDGLVRPGEMLLVLGRPESGCTTFLKTMAGYVHGVEVVQHDEGNGILYEGTSFDEMHRRYWGETIYLAEDDIHLPKLTLEETLAFAAEMRPLGQQQSPGVISRQTAAIYGLERALHTQAFLSGCPIQCCDNSIRGLDSATAMKVVRTLRAVANARGSTIMTTIYQAPETLYFQFDMSMIFRSVGSLSRTYAQSLAPVSIMIFNFIIYAGFVIPPPDQSDDQRIPASTVRMLDHGSVGPGYDAESSTLDGKICSAIGSVAGQSWVEGDRYLRLKYGYSIQHLWRNLGILFALMAGFCAVHLTAAEYIQAERSKGDILLFRRTKLSSTRHHAPADEESTEDAIRITEKSSSPESSSPLGEMRQTAQGLADKQFSSVFFWRNVGYEVKTDKKKEPTRILKGVDEWVKQGTLTALMGSTGAGKTTLLDVLANRKSLGMVYGEVRIDERLRDRCFQRKTGYVQQADIHLPTATVREALEFSALLRQPRDRSRQEKLAYVDTVLQMLQMEPYAEAVVGVPGKGLNIEQRKRLTIAVEMAARPELLFLDEPTSGLDSQTAWSICTLLRQLSDKGQAILCTVHQPSAELFQMFDRLLLLQEGKTLYFGDLGPSASTLIDYFSRSGACRMPDESENPAEWILNVTASSPTASASGSSWAEVWDTSPEAETVKREIKLMQTTRMTGDYVPSPSPNTAQEDYEYAAPGLTQLWLVTYRLTSFLFSCFLLTILFNTVDQQIIPRFLDNRAAFEARERQSKTYSWPVFVAANLIVELVWQSLAAIPVFVAWYYPTGFWRNGLQDNNANSVGMSSRAGLIFLLLWLFFIFSATLSQAIAAGLHDVLTAVNIANLLFTLCLLFCGILVQPAALPRFWIFLYRVSPVTYLMGGMISAAVANALLRCASVDLLRISWPTTQNLSTASCGTYLAPYIQRTGGQVLNLNATAIAGEDCVFCAVTDMNTVLAEMGVDVSMRWRDLGLFAVYVAANIAGTFGMYWLTRRKPS